jgi:hypothetical protein
MLFTDSSCHTQRLTESNISKLRACDHIERYKDCGWDCATGYRDGRVHVVVHANSKTDLDDAIGAEVRPLSSAHEIAGFLCDRITT